MLSRQEIEYQAQTFIDSVEGRYSFDFWADSKDFQPEDREKIRTAIKVLKAKALATNKGIVA